ncbi:restriction endonuclease subunit S [Lactobacillus amylovorus]|uniref:restriction endonuclease subunit S n=1 Tax=Lactobacillus amylovorus TaxID=1604 RepID=UPI0023309799|nr:restriction endonuclease subunit S [Lactobacillus amylovorus]MDB6235395.1 restriction endonuclease subunit S [Lactobacillus amylovorus]
MNRREVKRAPVLRFKGFTNDWEQHSLENLYNKIGNAFVGKATPFFTNHGHFYLESNNIKDGRINLKDQKFINDVFYIKQRDKWLHTNDLVMVQSGDVGQTSVITQKYNNCAAHALIMFRKPKNEYISNFLNSYFQSDVAISKIDKLKIGNTVYHLLASDMKTFKVTLPKHNSEAQKIIHIFNHLNRLQVLQQRKLELLKASKKAVLQNIFTDTKRVPTIRFNTFSENWNQKRLKPFLIKYNKKTTVNNQYPVLTSSRQGLFFQKDYYDGNQIASKNNIGYNIVPRNYFTYRHMSDDLIFHFNINTICDYGIVSTLYPVFTTTSEIDSQWLLYYLNHSVDIKKYALLQKQGGSRTYMYFSKLESLKAHIPALAEQKKISSLIFKIDEQIYFQQKKLKYLQKSKRFLLQNMFI